MRLGDLVFIRLLPYWMRGDLANQGLAHGIEAVNKPLVDAMALLPMWDRLATLPEADLDEIAWELNLFWYDKMAPVETKRALVKDGLKVWGKLGTVWAVENVISAYFGEGYVKEWFDYGGQPGRFRVYSSNPDVTNERLNEFLRILNMVKRASAHLDGIYITLTGEMKLAAGVAVHEVGYETNYIGATLEEG